MRAAAIDKFGDPEVLKLQPRLFPDQSEVLIEVDERKMTNPIRAFQAVSSVLEAGKSHPAFRDRRR